MCTLALVALFLSPYAAHAVTPDEVLQDPKLEARARELSQILRCVVCQNQSIDDSNAPLAHDLRVLVRERLSAGDTDKQAIAYLVARYGNFVLLRPPVQANTLLLWLGPALFLAIAVVGWPSAAQCSAAAGVWFDCRRGFMPRQLGWRAGLPVGRGPSGDGP